MSEFFTEHLVKRRATGATILKKAGLVVGTVLVTVASILFAPTLSLLALAGMIFLDSFLFRRMNIEFEYTYYNGDMDIDKIMNKESRKKLFSMRMKDLEVLAPTGATELQPFQRLKVLDFSSQNPNNKTYEMVTSHKGEKVRVIFEPNDVILNGMKYLAPRKVIF